MKTGFFKKTMDLAKSLNIDLARKFVVFNEVSSTNIIAKELARRGEKEGVVVVARVQKKGRGRFDRVWESPDGGLYLSVILRPNVTPDKTTLIPLVAAVAVHETLDSYGLPATIKWPNDVRINGKKIAGILLESELDEKKVVYVVLGVGINLNVDVDVFSPEIRLVSTSVSNELGVEVDYHVFLEKFLVSLDKYYTFFLNEEFDFILHEWKKHSDTIGKKVIVVTSSGKIKGKAVDIDESGYLIVESEGLIKVTTGDCIYVEDQFIL
jgi:BirA family biotin operon repressor/biotin-[acetyl-CoA-carboxylase] ligase